MALLLAFDLIRLSPGGLIGGTRWAGWWDQSLYLRSATAFAHLDLGAGEHWYPPLYPLLAAPFCWLLPANPFLPLDLMCVGATAHFALRVAALFGIGRPVGLLLFAGSTFLHPGFTNSWGFPWTSTLSAALLWFLVARAAELLLDPAQRAVTPRQAAPLGLAAVLVAAARPVDAIAAAALGVGLAIALIVHRRLPLASIAAAAGAALAAAAGCGLLHLAIYGPHPSGYMQLSSGYGLQFGNLGWKAYVLFSDPRPWFPMGTGLLRGVPWLAIGIAGLLAPLASRRTGMRAFAATALGAALVHMLAMAAYVDLLPPALWHFNNVHYFKWLLPLFAFAAWHFLRNLAHARRAGAAAIAAVLAVTGFRYDAVPAAAGETALRIDFFAAVPRDWPDVYFAPSAIVDAGGLSRNVVDYRQVSDGDRVRAIGLRRAFEGDARWIADGRTVAVWPPATVRQTRLDQPAADRPVARWQARLAWGVPCWLWPCADR